MISTVLDLKCRILCTFRVSIFYFHRTTEGSRFQNPIAFDYKGRELIDLVQKTKDWALMHGKLPDTFVSIPIHLSSSAGRLLKFMSA